MMGKIPAAAALYFPLKLIGASEGARCGNCMMFVMDHCTIVEGAINGETGVCGLYVHGEHAGPDMHGMMPKSVAGYVTNGPTHCANCRYFSAPSTCQKIDTNVEAGGCCNLWEQASVDRSRASLRGLGVLNG